jgi:hypothetical protein
MWWSDHSPGTARRSDAKVDTLPPISAQHVGIPMSLYSLFKDRLPINRKEVYYTATVLPCIVCADGFAHIHRLWQLLGIEAP